MTTQDPGILSAGDAPHRGSAADAAAAATHAAAVRRLVFWVCVIVCASCIGVDVVHLRVDGWAALALLAWLGMAAAFWTDIADDPYPDSRTSLDQRDGI